MDLIIRLRPVGASVNPCLIAHTKPALTRPPMPMRKRTPVPVVERPFAGATIHVMPLAMVRLPFSADERGEGYSMSNQQCRS